MTTTEVSSTKRSRASRLAEPTQGASGPPRLFGKTAGVAALVAHGFGGCYRTVLETFGRRVFRERQAFQKLVCGQDRAAGPTGCVLDLPIGADDNRSALPLARKSQDLMVGRQGGV